MSKSKSPNSIRLELVYGDSEFRKDAKKLLYDYLTALQKTEVSRDFRANVKDGYIRESSIRKFTPRLLSNFNDLLRVYSISEEELINYFTNSEVVGDNPAIVDLPDATDMMQTYKISVPIGTTLNDVKKAFEGIQQMRGSLGVKNTRHRGPQDPELLYRIRQLKLKGYSYPQIAELYENNTIPRYSKPTGVKRSYTAAELAQYYSDYKSYVVKPNT